MPVVSKVKIVISVKRLSFFFRSRFVVDRDDVNYIAISSNVAVAGTQGGPDKYEIYMKYGERAARDNFDYRTKLTSSESYLDGVLYR